MVTESFENPSRQQSRPQTKGFSRGVGIARAPWRRISLPLCATMMLAVSAIGPAACVSRHGAEAVIGRGAVVGEARSLTVIAAPAEPIPDSAWPSRIMLFPIAGDGTHEFGAPIRLILPVDRAPTQRVDLGRRGAGYVQRVALESFAEAAPLARLQSEQGLDAWLVVRTVTGEITPDRWPSPVWARESSRLFEVAETSFVLYLPDTAPRGLVLQMSNLAGNTDWERRMTQSLRAAGWAVLMTFAPEGWAATSQWPVDAAAPSAEIGQRIAAIVDDRLAEWAYAVEAILEHLALERPELPQRPMVGFGSSVGAISLPAVSTRLDRPFDAVVLVGGGADLLAILRGTTVGSSVVPIRWAGGRRPGAAAWPAIAEAYHAATRLDATRTAPLLRGTPILQLHADWDSIVPAPTGEIMWESLGRPERWRYRTGHIGLFVYWLPRERQRIVEWIDGALGLLP